MRIRALVTAILLVPLLSGCFGEYLNSVDDGSKAYDQILGQGSDDQKRQMEQVTQQMQAEMRSYLEKGRAESRQQTQDLLNAINMASLALQAKTEDVVKMAVSKAITSDPTLRAQLTGMAASDPQRLESMANQFLDSLRQQAGGGNQVTMGTAAFQSRLASEFASPAQARSGIAPARASTSRTLVEARRAALWSAGRGFGVSDARPDILVPRAFGAVTR